MASVWIEKRNGTRGARFRVRYRPSGWGMPVYGGSFKTRREALARKAWINGELAAMRVPDIKALAGAVSAPSLSDAAKQWRDSRIDVGETTKHMHRSAFLRIFEVAPDLRSRRIDAITVADATALVAALAAKPYKRETIRKTRTCLAHVLDHFSIDPNPVRDKRVRLPKERRAHIPPPLAEHVERVAETIAPKYVLPLLIIDACGPRVNELATALIGDLDEHENAIRIRPSEEKNENYRYLKLPADLFAALLATVPPREDRDLERSLLQDLTDANLRTAITRGCKATGTPHFSPHGLRRRRGSLHYKKTGSLAEVAELLGDSKRVSEQHYIYALTDYREADYPKLLERVRTVHPQLHPQDAENRSLAGTF